jgi:hypothetical protein
MMSAFSAPLFQVINAAYLGNHDANMLAGYGLGQLTVNMWYLAILTAFGSAS